MNYFKSVKKSRKKFSFKLIISVIITLVMFVILQITFSHLKSDNINLSTQDNMEKLCNCVVGISKTENDVSKWGSGVIVSNKGYIISNCHVTGEKDSECDIYWNNEKSKGLVIWANLDLDISILKVNKIFDEYISLGNSNDVRLGNDVFAIGNPINKR